MAPVELIADRAFSKRPANWSKNLCTTRARHPPTSPEPATATSRCWSNHCNRGSLSGLTDDGDLATQDATTFVHTINTEPGGGCRNRSGVPRSLSKANTAKLECESLARLSRQFERV